jgi:hypothetical protein
MGWEKIPETLFSPSKMAYIAFVLLAALGQFKELGFWTFVLVTLAFLALETFLNDFLRIALNNLGNRVGMGK